MNLEQIPDFLLEMSRQINTQDNRITADPIWMVCYDKEHITADGFEEYIQWVDRDNEHHVICNNEDCSNMPIYLKDHYPDWYNKFIVDNCIYGDCSADTEYFINYFDMDIHGYDLPSSIEKFYIVNFKKICISNTISSKTSHSPWAHNYWR